MTELKQSTRTRRISKYAGYLLYLLLLMAPASGFADSLDSEIRLLEEFSVSYNLIKTKYVKEKKSDELIRSAIKGMVTALDPYSDVLDTQDLEKLELQSVGQFVGIGVTINQTGNRFVVTQVYKDSPADKANIRAGYEIIKLNDSVLTDISYKKLRELLQGEIGSDLKLDYRKSDATGIVHQILLQRVLVKANSVECFRHSDSVAVLSIHQFMKHTVRELAACQKQLPSRAIILDLRSNPGGLLISAVEAADLFVDIGEVVQIRDKHNRIIERYVARSAIPEKRPILFVLMNRFSASASEILAGAIRDRKSGVLIGEKSFGKGVVQSVYPIGDDLFVKITTALYYTPSEVSFDEVGISPDHVVRDVITKRRYSEQDAVFQKALELVEAELFGKLDS